MRTPRAAPLHRKTRPSRPYARAGHSRVRTIAIRPTGAGAGTRYRSVPVLHCRSGRFVRRSYSPFPAGFRHPRGFPALSLGNRGTGPRISSSRTSSGPPAEQYAAPFGRGAVRVCVAHSAAGQQLATATRCRTASPGRARHRAGVDPHRRPPRPSPSSSIAAFRSASRLRSSALVLGPRVRIRLQFYVPRARPPQVVNRLAPPLHELRSSSSSTPDGRSAASERAPAPDAATAGEALVPPFREPGGSRAVRPPREPGPDAAEVDRIPRLLDPGTNTAAARVEGERAPSGRRALVGLESAPMDALGRAGRVERLTIQPRKKPMSVIAKAIAARQSEIERLQAEIKALNDVDKILGTSAPAKPAARRSSALRPAAATTPVAETASDATPARKRRPMTAKEKEAVSERMKASWAARRKKAAK